MKISDKYNLPLIRLFNLNLLIYELTMKKDSKRYAHLKRFFIGLP